MKTIIWTVSTHDGYLELPSETEVFTTKNEAIDYLILKNRIADMHSWQASQTEGSDGTIVIKYWQGSSLMQVSIMKCHEIKITDQ